MKNYRALFNGRVRGAIGVFEYFDVMVEAENEEQARLRLYDKYDHIIGLTLVEKSKAVAV